MNWNLIYWIISIVALAIVLFLFYKGFRNKTQSTNEEEKPEEQPTQEESKEDTEKTVEEEVNETLGVIEDSLNQQNETEKPAEN